MNFLLFISNYYVRMILLKETIKHSFSKNKWSHETKMNLNFKNIFLLFAAFIASQLLLALILSYLERTFTTFKIDNILMNIMFNFMMILIVVIIYNYRPFISDFFSKGTFNSKVVQSGIFYGLLATIINILLGLILFYLYSLLDLTPTEQHATQLIESNKNLSRVILYFSVAISAPIAEEIFFRGVIYRTFANKTSMRNAIIISSLIFSLLHFDLYYIPQIFIASVVLSIAYNETGNIVTPIIAHIISNSIFIIPLLLNS